MFFEKEKGIEWHIETDLFRKYPNCVIFYKAMISKEIEGNDDKYRRIQMLSSKVPKKAPKPKSVKPINNFETFYKYKTRQPRS